MPMPRADRLTSTCLDDSKNEQHHAARQKNDQYPRERVAPALSYVGVGCTELMAKKRLSGLQAKWAGTPLHVDRAANLVALFNELEMESAPLVAYDHALSDVVTRSDGFLRALRQAVDRGAEIEDELDLRGRRDQGRVGAPSQF